MVIGAAAGGARVLDACILACGRISSSASTIFTLFFFSCKQTPTNILENNNSGFVPDDGEALFILGQAN